MSRGKDQSKKGWICGKCGDRLGSWRAHSSTWHMGICGYCGQTAAVTDPRDYGYPEPKQAQRLGS